MHNWLRSSAGGHLAAASVMIKGFESDEDNKRICPAPDYLVLFNPVLDNGPSGYGYERIGKNYKKFSPLHNVKRKNVRPTIILLGENDNLFTVEAAQSFKNIMEKHGARCDLIVYPGETHGFFNQAKYKKETIKEMEKFFRSLDIME